MTNQTDNCCPLCRCDKPLPYFEDKNRVYLSCPDCCLVFVPAAYYLTPQAEKDEYDLHTNNPADKGYRRFLSRLSRPLLERLVSGQKGLDFGCGPGPVMHQLLEDHGCVMDLYDPFYANDTNVFSKTYDFITATEVVEHLHCPGREFDRLFNMLRNGGWLGIMTKLIIDKASFSRWHYIRDLTHVCFYSRATFEYLSQRYKTSLTFIGNDVILMKKPQR